MRRSENLQKILYPDKYETNYILTYYSFNYELESLLSASGYVDVFRVKYFKGLRFLENLKKNCVGQRALFEELKESDGIYSMKLKGEKNIRILFSFQKVENMEKVILYNCFEEKKTKDYKKGISIALERKKELFNLL